MAGKFEKFRGSGRGVPAEKGVPDTTGKPLAAGALVRRPTAEVPAKPDTPRPGALTRPGAPAADRIAVYREIGAAPPLAVAAKRVSAMILLDATSSMDSLIRFVKEQIAEILTRVQEQSRGNVTITIGTYRDYCDGSALLEFSEAGSDAARLVAWLQRIQVHGGGDTREAVEAALQHVLTKGGFDVVLLAADSPSHTREELDRLGKTQQPTAQELAVEFGRCKTPIHTFVVGGYEETRQDFGVIARNSGGQTGDLDGSEAMRDMAVMAILHSLGGVEAVRDYETRYRGQLTAGAQEFATRLLGPHRRS